MRFKLRVPNLKPRAKTQGSALLISIVLSALMLTVGIMSARLAVRELTLSSDLFYAERAYFSAESGVEKALLKLKNEPVAHVQPSPGIVHPSLEDAHTEVTIRNLINTTTGDFPEDEFSFTLGPLQTQRFRFLQDTDPDETTTPSTIPGPVAITQSGSKFFWRLLCKDLTDSTLTKALQEEATANISNLITTTGRLDDGTTETFNNWTSVDKDSCFISIQNLDSGDNTIAFSGTTMGMHAAHVHAVGSHQNRAKHIRFDCAQDTLGNLFDFSFLHSEDPI